MESFGHFVDKVHAIGHTRRFFYFLVGGIQTPDADVFHDARIKEHHVLEDDGCLFKEGVGGNILNIVVVDANGAGIVIVKAAHEF